MITIIALLFASILIMETKDTQTSFYDYTVTDITGEEVSLDIYKGKVIMIVNTASMCGFTKQYSDLQQLYETHRENGFVILGFPANNFGNQEPGSDEEIRAFCELNYNITFPMFSKVEVAGSDQHPLFSYLTQHENRDFTGSINWNFEKFLVDRDGQLLRRFRTRVNPMDDVIRNAVSELL